MKKVKENYFYERSHPVGTMNFSFKSIMYTGGKVSAKPLSANRPLRAKFLGQFFLPKSSLSTKLSFIT